MNPTEGPGKVDPVGPGVGVGLAAFLKDIALLTAENAAVFAAAVVPAALVQSGIDQDLVEANEEAAVAVEEAATKLGDEYDGDIARVRRIIKALSPEVNEDTGDYAKTVFGTYKWRAYDSADAILQGLSDITNRGQLYADIKKYGAEGGVLGWDPWTMLLRYWGEYTEPTTYGSEFPWRVGEDAGEKRVDNPLDQSEIDALLVYLRDMYTTKFEQLTTPLEDEDGITGQLEDASENIAAAAERAATSFDRLALRVDNIKLPAFANGLPYVPYDGYIAALHKGERVVPANANRNYNVYNNTYFDRTTVSGGVDADGLAARIATAQKRALSAVGS